MRNVRFRLPSASHLRRICLINIFCSKDASKRRNLERWARILKQATQRLGRLPLEFRGFWVQDPFKEFVEFEPGSPWLNFSAELANTQLVHLRPSWDSQQLIVVVVLFCRFVYCVSLALKSSYGEWSIRYVFVFVCITFFLYSIVDFARFIVNRFVLWKATVRYER